MQELIRSVRPLDLFRIGLSGSLQAQAQVVTLDRIEWPLGSASARRALWEESGLPRRGRCLRLAIEDGRPVGLARARMRSGPRVWEVRRLHLKAEAQGSAEALLEELSAVAGRHGASRLFLRLSVASPLEESARRSGFIPVLRETLLRREGPWTGSPERPQGLGPRQPADDFDIFRLFLACAPGEVRSAWALTLEEWRDALERLGGPGGEWVLRDEGSTGPTAGPTVRGWLQAWRRGGTGYIRLLAPPGEAATAALIRFALGSLEGRSPLLALVPDFQTEVAAELQAHGFQPVEGYQLLVKPIASRVREVEIVPARV